MRKSTIIILLVILGLVFAPSVSSRIRTIKIGINAPITGDNPKVGEGTTFTFIMPITS